jgi:hypothetical protein
MAQGKLDPPHFFADKSDRTAGAEFAEFILQAAFNGKSSTVQAYVHLSAESGGEAIKKEIGSDLDYFSVNVQLGVSSTLPSKS